MPKPKPFHFLPKAPEQAGEGNKANTSRLSSEYHTAPSASGQSPSVNTTGPIPPLVSLLGCGELDEVTQQVNWSAWKTLKHYTKHKSVKIFTSPTCCTSLGFFKIKQRIPDLTFCISLLSNYCRATFRWKREGAGKERWQWRERAVLKSLVKGKIMIFKINRGHP